MCNFYIRRPLILITFKPFLNGFHMKKEYLYQGAELRKKAQPVRKADGRLPEGVPDHFMQMSVPIGNEKSMKVFLFCTLMVQLPNGESSPCNFVLRKDKFKDQFKELLINHRCQCSQIDRFFPKKQNDDHEDSPATPPQLVEDIVIFACHCNISVRLIASDSFRTVIKSAISLGQQHPSEET
jgi:hypothetical protein